VVDSSLIRKQGVGRVRQLVLSPLIWVETRNGIWS